MLCLFLAVAPAALAAQSPSAQEQQVKAVFVYNFIKFVEWPDERPRDKDAPVTIGFVGSRDIATAFDLITHKRVKSRRMRVKYFEKYEKLTALAEANDQQWQRTIAALKTCDVLVLSRCNNVQMELARKVVRDLRGLPILTVGETSGFLELGGMINFLMEKKKVRFEINHLSAKQAKLQIRSQLLRLAKRVISKEPSGEAEK